MNIGSENISKEKTDFAVDIHFGKSEEKLIYFNNNPSIISKRVAELLPLKKLYKEKGYTSKEKSIKLVVNTMYGFMN